MKYTQAQIEKLIIERDMLRKEPRCKELAEREAELNEVSLYCTAAYFDAVATVYSAEAAA